MKPLSLYEACRLSEERFFAAIDKALEKLTERQIAQALGASIPSIQCWAKHTRAPHPAVRRRILFVLEGLLTKEIDDAVTRSD
jgi:hypothetical protein